MPASVVASPIDLSSGNDSKIHIFIVKKLLLWLFLAKKTPLGLLILIASHLFLPIYSADATPFLSASRAQQQFNSLNLGSTITSTNGQEDLCSKYNSNTNNGLSLNKEMWVFFDMAQAGTSRKSLWVEAGAQKSSVAKSLQDQINQIFWQGHCIGYYLPDDFGNIYFYNTPYGTAGSIGTHSYEIKQIAVEYTRASIPAESSQFLAQNKPEPNRPEPTRKANKYVSREKFISEAEAIGTIPPNAKLVSAKLVTWSDYEADEFQGADFIDVSKDRMVWVVKLIFPQGVETEAGFFENARQTLVIDAETKEIIVYGVTGKPSKEKDFGLKPTFLEPQKFPEPKK